MTQDTICPACHQTNLPRARFCQQCGHDVILNNAGPQYFLTRVLKAGGQGSVYQGRDEAGKIYAVKEMLDNFSDPKERASAVSRFQAEAEMLRRLTHPHIPRIYASFDDEGRHYLVMDFIKGEDLEDIVAREGPQPEDRVLAWADELCAVLEYMHGQGLIYRDMKPANVMREHTTGTLKLIDFGIAKAFQVNVRGTQIGTPGYAPPEQYQGLATKQSDVYALGATLHHLLSGRDPQDESPFSFPRLRALVPAISSRTDAAIARALEMRQEDRFQSITELRAAMRPAPATAPQVILPTSAAAAAATGAPPQPAAAPAPKAAPPPAPAPIPPTARIPTAAPPPAPAPIPPTARIPTAAPPHAPAPAPKAAPPPAPAPAPKAAPPPAPAPAPTPAATATPPPAARRRSWLGCFVGLLLVIGLAVGGILFAYPELLPTAAPSVTATPVVLVERQFSYSFDIQVNEGSSATVINNAFVEAFDTFASAECNCRPQIIEGSLIFATGPEQTSTDGRRATYRATVEARALVPQE